MLFWLIDPWDALPGELGYERGSQVANALAARGHRVLWWHSKFSHAEKVVRDRDVVNISDRIEVRLLPAHSYESNVSYGRFLSILDFVRGFAAHSLQAELPDAIFVSGPLFFAGLPLLRLRVERAVPLAFEFRDLWPETLVRAVTGVRRLCFRAALAPLALERRLIFRHCDAIVGLNRTYLEVARNEAGNRLDIDFSVAYPSPDVGNLAGCAQRRKPPGQIWVISSGTLGVSHDHNSLLSAAKILRRTHPHIKFIITGAGQYADSISAEIRSEALQNVDFVGALPTAEFRELLRECDIGLALYRRFSPVVFPTKIVDYLLAGLAVLVSGEGEGSNLVVAENVGRAVPFEAGEAVAQAIVEYAGDQQLLDEAKNQARRIAPRFSHGAQMDKIVRVLERISRRNRPQRII